MAKLFFWATNRSLPELSTPVGFLPIRLEEKTGYWWYNTGRNEISPGRI